MRILLKYSSFVLISILLTQAPISLGADSNAKKKAANIKSKYKNSTTQKPVTTPPKQPEAKKTYTTDDLLEMADKYKIKAPALFSSRINKQPGLIVVKDNEAMLVSHTINGIGYNTPTNGKYELKNGLDLTIENGKIIKFSEREKMNLDGEEFFKEASMPCNLMKYDLAKEKFLNNNLNILSDYELYNENTQDPDSSIRIAIVKNNTNSSRSKFLAFHYTKLGYIGCLTHEYYRKLTNEEILESGITDMTRAANILKPIEEYNPNGTEEPYMRSKYGMLLYYHDGKNKLPDLKYKSIVTQSVVAKPDTAITNTEDTGTTSSAPAPTPEQIEEYNQIKKIKKKIDEVEQEGN